MNLKEQLQESINNSSKFNLSPIVIEKAIAPVLVKIAKALKNVYYVWKEWYHTSWQKWQE